MRKLFLIFLMSILYLPLQAGKIPEFKLKDINNQSQSYKNLKGDSLTVIDFWATWCKPCVSSIPELIGLYEKYKERGVTFIGISVDGPRNLAKVRPFAESLGITYPVLLDANGSVMTKMQVTAIPTVIFVNQKDEIVLFHQGYRPGDADVLKEEIEKVLGQHKDVNE